MDDREMRNVKRVIIVEAVMLIAAAVILRIWVFPYLAEGGMKHVAVATHAFMIGITATIFSAVAISVKRLWKTHKIYVLIPVIFTVFGYLMLMAANDLNF